MNMTYYKNKYITHWVKESYKSKKSFEEYHDKIILTRSTTSIMLFSRSLFISARGL